MPAAGAIRTLQVYDDLPCNGGVRLGWVTGWIEASGRHVLTGDSTERLRVLRSSVGYSLLTTGRVLRQRFRSGTTRDWRSDGPVEIGRNSGDAVIDCRDIALDLARPGDMYTVLPDGSRSYKFSVTQLTYTEILTTIVLPWLATNPTYPMSYWSVGTIDFTGRIDLEWEDKTAYEVVGLLRDWVDFRGEFAATPDGTDTGYLIDLVAKRESARTPLVARTRVNLADLVIQAQPERHFTEIEGRGNPNPDTSPATIGDALWEVTTTNAHGSSRITLADPDGGPSPIQYDHQFDGKYFQREYAGDGSLRGGAHLILDTIADTSELVLADTSSYTANAKELGRIIDAPGTTRLYDSHMIGGGQTTPSTFSPSGVTGFLLPWRISAKVGSTIDVEWPWVGARDPITRGSYYNGWTCDIYSKIIDSVTNAGFGPGGAWITYDPTTGESTVYVDSTASMQVGDLAIGSTSDTDSAPPWATPVGVVGTAAGLGIITAIVDGHAFRAKGGFFPWNAAAFLANTNLGGSGPRINVYRIAGTTTVGGTGAGTGTTGQLTLADATQATVGRLVILSRLVGGEQMTRLRHPAAAVKYRPVKCGRFSAPSGTSLASRMPNGYLKRFTAGVHAPPDGGYSVAAAKATNQQSSATEIGLAGDSAWKLQPNELTNLAAQMNAGSFTAQLNSVDGFEPGDVVTVGYLSGSSEALTIAVGGVNPTTKILTFTSAAGTTHVAGQIVITGTAANTTLRSTANTVESLGYLPFLPVPSVLPSGDIWYVLARVKLVSTQADAQILLNLENNPTAVVGSTSVVNQWTTLSIARTYQHGRPLWARIDIKSGASGGLPAGSYVLVDWVALVRANYDPLQVRDRMPEYSYAAQLHQATNAKLLEVSDPPPAVYRATLVDLQLLGLSADEIVVGRRIRVVAPDLDTDVTLRILEYTPNWDHPEQSQVTFSSQFDALTQILATATVPVPRVTVTINPSAPGGVDVDVSAVPIQQPVILSAT
ncbi:MAG TPA: phage tail protein [Candidatus Limnocylindria bacterium]|nr:phage tail protein [Candidatus Limnocylindria bacterium]